MCPSLHGPMPICLCMHLYMIVCEWVRVCVIASPCPGGAFDRVGTHSHRSWTISCATPSCHPCTLFYHAYTAYCLHSITSYSFASRTRPRVTGLDGVKCCTGNYSDRQPARSRGHSDYTHTRVRTAIVDNAQVYNTRYNGET